MMSMRIRWWWVVILFAVCNILVRSCEGKSRECSSSSSPSSYCRETLKITYPFRLKGDPDTCGRSNFELSCENNRSTMIELGSWKYQVHEIDYHKRRMRASDPTIQKENCSFLPTHSPLKSPFAFVTYTPYFDFDFDSSSYVIILLNCKNPVTTSSPKYIKLNTDSSCIINSSSSSSNYVVGGLIDELRVSDIEDSCTVNLIYPIISWPFNKSSSSNANASLSFQDIHNQFLFGFQLRWSPIYSAVSDAVDMLRIAFLWLGMEEFGISSQ